MLKTRDVSLSGRDAGRSVRLTELPALVADRHARAALRALGEDLAGGVVTLAMQHAQALRARSETGLQLMLPFIEQRMCDAATGAALALGDLQDWRSIGKLQQHALLLHAGFLIGREQIEIPVTLQAAHIVQDTPNISAKFCSPHIAVVLDSELATYRDLETSLSTEDVFNLVEILNVRAIREWHAHQKASRA